MSQIKNLRIRLMESVPILEIRTRRFMQRYTQEIEKSNPDFINCLEEALMRIDSGVNELLRDMRELSNMK